MGRLSDLAKKSETPEKKFRDNNVIFRRMPPQTERPAHEIENEAREIAAEEVGKELATDNFSGTLHSAIESLNNQLHIASKKDGVTSKDVSIAREKSNLVFDALNKAIHLSHLQEIISQNEKKFKRLDELKVLSPLLESLQQAAEMARKSVGFFLREMDKELSKDEPDEVRINTLQEGYERSLSNINRTVVSLDKTIRLERLSGGRSWKEQALPKLQSSKYVEDPEGDDEKGPSEEKSGVGQIPHRKITPHDMRKIVGGQLKADPIELPGRKVVQETLMGESAGPSDLPGDDFETGETIGVGFDEEDGAEDSYDERE